MGGGGTEQQKWLFHLSLSHGNFLGYILLNMTHEEEKRPLVQSTGGEVVSIVVVAFAPAKSCPQVIEEDAYTNTPIIVGYSSGGDFWASSFYIFPILCNDFYVGRTNEGLDNRDHTYRSGVNSRSPLLMHALPSP